MFIGLDSGLDQPQLTDLTRYDMPFICEQNEFALSPPASSSKLLFGYNQMDEPDNAQADPNHKGQYLPCVSPNVTLARYNAWKRKDPSRPVFQGLGQGVSCEKPTEQQQQPIAMISTVISLQERAAIL